MKVISKILATIVFGLLVATLASPLAAATVDTGISNYIFLGALVLVAVLSFTAPTGRRAWGRGSLLTGVLFIVLPLTVGTLSGVVANEMITDASVQDQGATAVGATIGAGLMVGASAFVGFILGAVFIILGLVLTLGGRREVIVVENRDK